MRNIKESLNEIQGITPYLKGERLDEGLKEILNTVKSKFKQVFVYLKSVVVKVGTYFLGTDVEGNVLPAITPLTAGSAYADGSINKDSTVVIMDKEGAKITGCKGKFSDIAKLKGPGNSIRFWEMINEHEQDPEIANIVESYLETVNEVFKIEKDGIDLVEETSEIVDMEIPEILYEIYNKKVEKEVWEKEEMEKELLKLIGEIDENC